MDNLPKEYDRWLRLMILIDYGGSKLCHDVLFNQEGLPKDGVALQSQMTSLKNKLNKDQRGKVFPGNGNPDYTTFDVTLLTDIIRHKFVDKYNSLVSDLKKWRNDIVHRGNKRLSTDEFNQLWRDISDMLQQQQQHFNLSLINLKSVSNLEVHDIILHQEYRHIIVFILQGNINIFLLL